MGRLTTDFTRMVDGIRSARASRNQLNQAIRHAAAERRRTVSRMLEGFHAAQSQMARRQRSVLHEFMMGVRNNVQALRSGLRTDLAGARAIWFGTMPASPPPAREHSKRATKAA